MRGQQLQLGDNTDRAVEDLIQESIARHGRHGAVQRRLSNTMLTSVKISWLRLPGLRSLFLFEKYLTYSTLVEKVSEAN